MAKNRHDFFGGIPGDYFDDPVERAVGRRVARRQPPQKPRSGLHGLLLLLHGTHLAHAIWIGLGVVGAGTASVAIYQHYAPSSSAMIQSPQSIQQKMQSPDVKELAFQIDSFYAQHGRLPRDVQELRMSSPGAFMPGPMSNPLTSEVSYAATGPGQYKLTIKGPGLMSDMTVPMSVPHDIGVSGAPLMRSMWEGTYETRTMTAAINAQPGPAMPSGYVPGNPTYPGSPAYPGNPGSPGYAPPSPYYTPPSPPSPWRPSGPSGPSGPSFPSGPSGPSMPSAPMPGGGGRR